MLVAVAGFSFASRVGAETQLVNAIQAVVHDSVITFAELQDRMAPVKDVLIRQHRGQPELLQQKVTTALNENLEQLIERQLILQDFREKFSQKEQQDHANKIINKDIDKGIAEEIRSELGGDRVAFVRTLRARGITLERHRQQIRDRIIASWLRQENISSEIIISPYKVEEYYLSRRDEFKVQEEVKLRMIVLKCAGESEAAQTRARAEDILRKIKEGATFEEMAGANSEGSQRSQGGDWGWWELTNLSRSMADMARSLQAGQYSGVLSRSAGDDYWFCQYSNGVPTLARHYVADLVLKKEDLVEERRFETAAAAADLPPPVEFYLMQVDDKRSARFKTLAEVREQIEQDLLAKEQRRLANLWLDRLKKKTFVRAF